MRQINMKLTEPELFSQRGPDGDVTNLNVVLDALVAPKRWRSDSDDRARRIEHLADLLDSMAFGDTIYCPTQLSTRILKDGPRLIDPVRIMVIDDMIGSERLQVCSILLRSGGDYERLGR